MLYAFEEKTERKKTLRIQNQAPGIQYQITGIQYPTPNLLMDGVGHLPMIENPEETATLYLSFLEQTPWLHKQNGKGRE